jgi:hypothetical protein
MGISIIPEVVSPSADRETDVISCLKKYEDDWIQMLSLKAACLLLFVAANCVVLAQTPAIGSMDSLASTIAPSLPSSSEEMPGKVVDVGRLVIMLFDAGGGEQPGADARVVLYDSTCIPVAQELANSSSTATFDGVPAGRGYYCLAYAGASSVWGEELWGEKTEIAVAADETTYEMIKHNMPSIEEVHLYLDKTVRCLREIDIPIERLRGEWFLL